ncbi:MAG: cytochrome c biogenesis protein CcsA [Rhodospirillales bacterium]|nr:cytochrome c biogenesis protein CcsA [Rhodospirillales bacterium]
MFAGFVALSALVPALLLGWFRPARRDGAWWASLFLATAGPLVWSVLQLQSGWHAGFSATLWVSVSASLVLFALLAALTPDGWRLLPILIPYLFILSLLALVWGHAPERAMSGTAPTAWIGIHIGVSVLTYGLCTLAAMASLAAFLQERALKLKKPTNLTRALPSVADSESLTVRLLAASEIVLGLGLATGMATLYFESGSMLRLDHKILLSLLAFAVIGGLLLAQRLIGIRGRMAARFVLLAYLLLTLAYPGVKFVTDVLLGRAA